jgi:hypothetical protein
MLLEYLLEVEVTYYWKLLFDLKPKDLYCKCCSGNAFICSQAFIQNHLLMYKLLINNKTISNT